MLNKNKIDLIRSIASLDERQQLHIRTSKTPAELEKILAECGIVTSSSLPNWLVILLKVIAYSIGLILAGYGTSAAAQVLI